MLFGCRLVAVCSGLFVTLEEVWTRYIHDCWQNTLRTTQSFLCCLGTICSIEKKSFKFYNNALSSKVVSDSLLSISVSFTGRGCLFLSVDINRRISQTVLFILSRHPFRKGDFALVIGFLVNHPLFKLSQALAFS